MVPTFKVKKKTFPSSFKGERLKKGKASPASRGL